MSSHELQSKITEVLKARTKAIQTMEYTLRWKTWKVLAGNPIPALRASARRISDQGFTGWHTPEAHPRTFEPRKCAHGTVPLANQVQLTGWLTPKTPTGGIDPNADPTHMYRLDDAVALTSWATPTVHDSGTGGASTGKRGARCLQREARLAGWPTPMVGSPAKYDESGKKIYNEAGNNDSSRKMLELCQPSAQNAAEQPLTQDMPCQGECVRAVQVGWPTPAARDFRDIRTNMHGQNARPLNEVAGLTSNSSTAETANLAESALNPAMSRWLQNYPVQWDRCSPGWKEWDLMQSLLARR